MKINCWKLPFLMVLMFSSFSLWSDVAIKSTVKVSSQWNNGYILNVDITNNTNNPLKGWSATFTVPSTQTIDSLWSGKYVAVGKNITVKNETWNGNLQPGQTVTFGIQIIGTGTQNILNLTATGDNGLPVDPTDPTDPTDPVEPLPVKLTPSQSVISTWTGGKQITLELLNPSSQAINRWVVDFDLAAGELVTGLCGGEFTQTSGHVKITNPLWVGGGIIATGGKVSITILLKSLNDAQTLTNVVASGNPVDNVEVPGAPVLNPISNDDKDGNYTVSWKAVSGAIRYTLQESTSSNFANPVNILSENALQKKFQGQAAGVYYYRVAAVGQNITGAFSNVNSVTVQNTPPTIGMPVLNQIDNTDLDNNYIVIWSAVENATGYILEESKDVNFSSPVEVYNGADTRKNITLKANGIYYYRVKAKNTAQVGQFSNVISVTVNITTPTNPNMKIIGYFPNWAMYRARPFYAKDINPNVVTHINYAFAPVDVDGTIRLFDPWSDTDFYTPNAGDKAYAGNFYQLYQLKKQNPKLKTLISLGGWTLSNPFSQMASTAAVREKFAQNCVDFCKKYDFDGIDIDWEYPGFADHSGRPEDTINFTLLLQTVSAKLKSQNPPLLLTIAAPAGPNHYRNIEVSKIHQYLDWINIMGYDFHGPWGGDEDALTNHLASLLAPEYGSPLFNVTSAVDYYISQGVPSSKVVLGMPLYGRSFA
ncbi:MAG TPA: glycosyl hydrolase family 18 protein, partial [Parachlamydiaceae bacterium]|nr:glycosyl hydrolase family 18 protein [Parachlamydiaceae bacterium]